MIRLFLMLVYLMIPFAASAAWLESLNDVPLMTGFVEDKSNQLIFDKAEGRVVESVAFGPQNITAQQVRSFYQQALPELGWREISPLVFIRDKEQLRIRITPMGTQTQLAFALWPK